MASLRRMMHRSHNAALVYNPSLENHPTLFDVKFSVEKDYIRHETTRLMSQRLKIALDKLPPRQKEVVYLKFFQELSRDQIAAVMNISPQTVSNLLQIAMKQLRRNWKAIFLPALPFDIIDLFLVNYGTFLQIYPRISEISLIF